MVRFQYALDFEPWELATIICTVALVVFWWLGVIDFNNLLRRQPTTINQGTRPQLTQAAHHTPTRGGGSKRRAEAAYGRESAHGWTYGS